MFWFGLDKCQMPTKNALSLTLLSCTGQMKYDERVEGRDKDRERSLTNYWHRQNRLNLGRKGKFTLFTLFSPCFACYVSITIFILDSSSLLPGSPKVFWFCLNLQLRTTQLLSHSFPLASRIGRRKEKGKNSWLGMRTV